MSGAFPVFLFKPKGQGFATLSASIPKFSVSKNLPIILKNVPFLGEFLWRFLQA